MYNALVDAFAIPGKQNISSLVDTIAASKQKFKVSLAIASVLIHLTQCALRNLVFWVTSWRTRICPAGGTSRSTLRAYGMP